MALPSSQNITSLLLTQNADIVEEFCNIAVQSIDEELSGKVLTSASNKLKVDASEIEATITGLISMFYWAVDSNIEQKAFEERLLGFNVPKDSAVVITKSYIESTDRIRRYKKLAGVKTPSYSNMEWRYDVILGTRSLHDIVEPIVTLELQLDNVESSGEIGKKEIVLQTDPNCLQHITNVLEKALQESRTHHFRKLQHHSKK